jgi:hypothetical protein
MSSRLLVTVFSLALTFMVTGCKSSGPTRLCEGFESYQSVAAVRAELERRGSIAGWKEDSQGTDPADRRPPYKLIYLSGPFKASGIEGTLKFTFYNDRLMETQFSTPQGPDFLRALRPQYSMLPQKPAEEVLADRHTKLRFDSGTNGSLIFTWYDSGLQKEWRNWVASNS